MPSFIGRRHATAAFLLAAERVACIELENQVLTTLIFACGEPLPPDHNPRRVELCQQPPKPYVPDTVVRWQCDSRNGELLCNRYTLVGTAT
jgi:two-component system sensor histidine kinase FlrB